jgi:hypothetical protein
MNFQKELDTQFETWTNEAFLDGRVEELYQEIRKANARLLESPCNYEHELVEQKLEYNKKYYETSALLLLLGDVEQDFYADNNIVDKVISELYIDRRGFEGNEGLMNSVLLKMQEWTCKRDDICKNACKFIAKRFNYHGY